MTSILRSSLLAAALIVVPAAAYSETQAPAADQSKGSQTEMNKDSSGAMPAKPSAKTTGSGASQAQDPQKKARDDNKDYGKPDKH